MTARKKRRQPDSEEAPAGREEEVQPETAPVPEDQRGKALKRAQDLIARAVHESTPEEEARTSALVAARTIHAEKLLDPPPRHPLLDRLEVLPDAVLDRVAGVVEAVLDEEMSGRGAVAMRAQAARWRAEATELQRKYDLYAGSLRWVLQGFKLGLVDRAGICELCRRPLQLGDVIVWKRRRFEAAHYGCCAVALQRQGAIPR